jgi:phytoene dehydrogenase-like protein
VRYDAAIIGAGAEGLAAAALLAKAGARTIVVERSERAGGRAVTREFHPGFRASPFADELAPVPADIHWALDLSRRGAIFRPAPSVAIWPDRQTTLRSSATGQSPIQRFLRSAEARAANVRARAAQEIDSAPRRPFFARAAAPAPWPCEDWMASSIAGVAAREIDDPDLAAHLAAAALGGRIADPFLSGTALHLLALGRSGLVTGGLSTLADALAAAAREAGAEISLGLDATDIRHARGRVSGIGLATGSEIEARAVISTLDLKRTFLSFFQWNALPKEIVQAVGAFRMAGATARVLFALESVPGLANAKRGAIHVAPDLDDLADANSAWRSGTIAAHLPVSLRIVSAADPGLAPPGSAVVTATLGAVPYRLFDGAWTREKREILRARALAALETAMPGAGAHVIAAETIAPPDIEEALGTTDGDLLGAELAADQMSSAWPDFPFPRSPLKGLYLAGSRLGMGASATCAAGAAAARIVAADLAAGKLR